jgi:transcription antitermination factor NusG
VDQIVAEFLLGRRVVPTVRWHVLRTQPRHEKVVAERLRFKSVEAFLPTRPTLSRRKDRSVLIDRPIFPGYVFVRVNLSDRLQVLSIPGVTKMLCFNGAPAAVEDAEIDAVRLCLKVGHNPESHPFLQVGELVRVTSGALAGIQGIVTRHKNRCRVVVSIALLHQSMSVEIDSELLSPAGDASRKRTNAFAEDPKNALFSEHRVASNEDLGRRTTSQSPLYLV